ncbi:MAG TPA: hypothetical protein VJM31_10725 [Vicinamibacterales bacterium]|nr:hypothetical protein [Vicinamibacterales bacterium]
MTKSRCARCLSWRSIRLLSTGRGLTRDHKPVVVYVAPTRQFRTIKTFDDVKDLLAQGDSGSVERIVSELHLDLVHHRATG